jgi:uncharacterized protein YigA (DUF484 family)
MAWRTDSNYFRGNDPPAKSVNPLPPLDDGNRMTVDKASPSSPESVKTIVEGDQVENYLREHASFFKHRPELLMSMELPHGGAGAVSLVERQVTLLRERNIEMRNRLALITKTAQANDELLQATRQMVLDLVQLRDEATLGQIISAGLKNYFSVEHGEVIWLDKSAVMTPVDDQRAQVVMGLMRQSQAYCGVFRSEEMSALFPDCKSEGSAALAPLVRGDTLLGILAVGSADSKRYDSEVGTLFLEYLADVLMSLPCMDLKDSA